MSLWCQYKFGANWPQGALVRSVQMFYFSVLLFSGVHVHTVSFPEVLFRLPFWSPNIYYFFVEKLYDFGQEISVSFEERPSVSLNVLFSH